jgi:hypothetical protein
LPIGYAFKNLIDMNRHHSATLALFILIQFICWTGAAAQIKGKITDGKTGKPLANVEVFINNSTMASNSDEAGQFNLKCGLTGFYDLVLYKPGYSIYRASMKIQSGRLYSLNLTLRPAERKKTTKLSPEERKMIKDLLTNEPTSASTLLNESDLGVSRSDGHSVLIIKDPLLIRNETTGYLLKYYADETLLSEIYQAPVLFENQPTADIKKSISWEKNRKEYFNGSLRHWLMAAVAGRLREEGFSCQDANGNEIDPKTLVSPSSIVGYKKVNASTTLVIHYRHDNTSLKKGSLSTGMPVDVSEAGLPINSKALVVKGQLIKPGLADQLPLDYLPVAGNVDDAYAETMKRFYEKIYIHTDKPYYYPGESIWFKTYLNYYYQPWKDSLSKTLYAELIGPNKKIIMEKTLRIDSGMTDNNFILPDSVKAGNYYLRAYTNLNRNFGDSGLYVKLIPVLSLTDDIDSLVDAKAPAEENLTIKSDKTIYHSREKITLTFVVKGQRGTSPNAFFSVSVTDAVQVKPILSTHTILNSFRPEPMRKISTWQFDVENGVGLRGRFVDEWGKPKKLPLTIIQTKPRKVFFNESDEQGIFLQTDLDFYDTLTFAFKQNKIKNISYGKFELLPREIPPLTFNVSPYHAPAKSTQARQRIVSEYRPSHDSKMLKEVVIKARKVDEPVDRVRRPYGIPDATLTERDFKPGYPNILYSLVGKVAGLRVEPSTSSIAFTRATSQSVGFQQGPLVTIDDVPMGGDAGTTLSMINPASIESISFTKRLNVLYGSQGNAGVISVYLKKGVSADAFTKDFQSIKVPGYSPSHRFRFPDYNDSKTDKSLVDFRSTIYWNPRVETRGDLASKPISFFAADLPGKYRIIAEGVTAEGEPVRGEVFIEIVNE